MLNFIVLGIVPGTTVQITFAEIVLALSAFAAISAMVSHYLAARLRRTQSRTVLNQLAI